VEYLAKENFKQYLSFLIDRVTANASDGSKELLNYLQNESKERSNQRLQLIEAVLTMRGWLS